MTCSLKEVHQHFRGIYCLHLQDHTIIQASNQQAALWMMVVVYLTKILKNFYQTTQCHIPEYSDHCENLKSKIPHIVIPSV
jgi:hypothetical protein